MRAPGPIHLLGQTVKQRHICVLHRGSEDPFALLGAFVGETLDGGERAIDFVHARPAHLDHLHAAGLSTNGPEATRQLQVREWRDAYPTIRPFSRLLMLRYVRALLDEGR
ncbi:MAG: hypothetical protein ACREBE_15335, partial [bacterium]